MEKIVNLKSARAALDLTQKNLAEAAGTCLQTMNSMENGDCTVTIKLCTALCRVPGKTTKAMQLSRTTRSRYSAAE